MSIPTMDMELSTKIAQLELVSEDLPAVIIIHNIQTQTVEYMSPWGNACSAPICRNCGKWALLISIASSILPRWTTTYPASCK